MKLLLLLLLLQPPVVPPEPVPAPQLTIEGPSQVNAGHLVKLRMVTSDKDIMFCEWTSVDDIPEDDTYTDDNGRVFVFSTPKPGDYRFVASVSGPGQLITRRHVVRVVGSLPQPPPPGPGPQPPQPPGASLAVFVRGQLANVTSPDKAAECAKLAMGYRLTADAIDAGVLKTIPDILARQQTTNRLAIPEPNRQSWASFAAALKTELESRGPISIAQHATLWREIAAGLESGPAPIPPEKSGATMLIFTGDRCVPCRQMKPIIAQLKRPYRIINLDNPKGDEPAIIARHKIEWMPTFLTLDGDRETGRLTGVRTLAELEALGK